MINLSLPSPLDYEFAFDLMKENMKKYYDFYGISWDQEWLRKNYLSKENYIITKLNKRIGFLSVEKTPNELYVHTIQVCPAFQNQRIGLYTLRALTEIVRSFGLRNIVCRVFKDSPVLAMYERLGFERVSQENFLITLKYDMSENDCGNEVVRTLTRRSSGRAKSGAPLNFTLSIKKLNCRRTNGNRKK